MFPAFLKKETEKETAVNGVFSLVSKTHPLGMKLNAPDRERFVFHCFNDSILCMQHNAKSVSRPVHTLMMGTVYGKTGSIDVFNERAGLCTTGMNPINPHTDMLMVF